MKIYEYGNQNKSKILLIHGMWMTHEMMLPYVDQLMDDYHIIAPDLTGHGNDKGRFESAQKEAAEITDWLMQNQMKELALVFGVSLGSVIAMNVISHEELLHTHCAVMEGASLTCVYGVEWLFRAMFRGMKKRPETIANLYASMQDWMQMYSRSFWTRWRIRIKRSFSIWYMPAIAIRLKNARFRRSCSDTYFFEFGNRDSHLVCQKAIRKYYPEAKITTRKGYGHCGYMFAHGKDYAALLRSYTEKEK